MKLATFSRLTQDQQENMIHIYGVTLMASQGCNNFQLIHLGKITRNYYAPVTCYHLIKRQSERYIKQKI